MICNNEKAIKKSNDIQKIKYPKIEIEKYCSCTLDCVHEHTEFF